jgi:NADH-ubiquinone oxidoreductase chain 1
LLFCIIFLGSDLYSFLFYIRIVFISFLFVWVRGTLPVFMVWIGTALLYS